MKYKVLKAFRNNRLPSPNPQNRAWPKDLVFSVREDGQTMSIIRELEEKKFIARADAEDERNATPENGYKATKEVKKRGRKKSE